MFTRVKKSRNSEYLQIVENYRDGGRVRQRMVHYVGHYDSLDHALNGMSRELRRLRGRATRAENDYRWLVAEHTDVEDWPQQKREAEGKRREAGALATRLEELRGLVEAHPDLLDRDRDRAQRRRRRQEAMARGREARINRAK